MRSSECKPITDNQRAKICEGFCPFYACSEPLIPATERGRWTIASGVCRYHGWFIYRRAFDRGVELLSRHPDVTPERCTILRVSGFRVDDPNGTDFVRLPRIVTPPVTR